jgi:hypothetical protein
MADEILREFRGIDDDTMLTDADTMIALFHDDLADFTGFDAVLDATFESDWQDDIDAARDTDSDETVTDQIEQLTATVNDTWDDCKTCFQDAKYFVEKAFPNNVAAQNEFGFDDYRKMSRDQDKVFPFMVQFHKVAEREKVKLIAAGFPQIKIDAIKTFGDAYHAAQIAQEAAKKARFLTTQDRVTKMNNVWHRIQAVNRASKTLYRTNFAKLQQYMLPAAGSNAPQEDLSVTGNMSLSTDGTPRTEGDISLPVHGITVHPDNNGNYAFPTGIPEGNTPITASSPDCTPQTSDVTIVEGATVTKNFSMVPV